MAETLIITDTTVLIALEQIDALTLLRNLFDNLIAPPCSSSGIWLDP